MPVAGHRSVHRRTRQRMEQTVDLLPKLGLAEQTLTQSDPIQLAGGTKEGIAKGGTQGQPTRLIDIQKMTAALVDIDQRRQTVAGQQTADATFA
jgi:hypothetical protein